MHVKGLQFPLNPCFLFSAKATKAAEWRGATCSLPLSCFELSCAVPLQFNKKAPPPHTQLSGGECSKSLEILAFCSPQNSQKQLSSWEKAFLTTQLVLAFFALPLKFNRTAQDSPKQLSSGKQAAPCRSSIFQAFCKPHFNRGFGAINQLSL